MKEYHVARTEEGVKLFRIETEGTVSKCFDILPDDSQRVINHSPDGFEFGYSGSGPAQLALAVLLDCFQDAAPDPVLVATEHHQAFKEAFIARQDQDKKEFTITHREIMRWFTARLMEKPARL